MSITGLNHYNLRASQPLLDELRNFYIAVVGLSPGPRPPFDSVGYWLYAGAQDVLHLTKVSPGETRDENHSAGVISSIDHIAFTCTDIEAAQTRLRNYHVQFTLENVPLTQVQQLFFRDPAGNGVELSCPMDSTIAARISGAAP